MTTRRSSASTTAVRRSGGSTRPGGAVRPSGSKRSGGSVRSGGAARSSGSRRSGGSVRSRAASPPFPPIPWILGFPGPSLPPSLGDAIARGELAGLILFRDNFGESWETASKLCREIRGRVPAGQPFLFAADEEGGLISQTSRLRLPDGSTWPGVPTPRALGRIDDPGAARFVGRLLGRRLRSLGCTVDFAPSLDLDTEAANPVIGSRSFGADPRRVAVLGEAFARGLGEVGVAACYKHFPGHGGTRQDSHRELPRMDARLLPIHAAPFLECLRRGGASPPWVMSGHVDWGFDLPASLDESTASFLRRGNRRALRLTDALDMRALRSVEWAASRAWCAGYDLLLVGRDWRAGLAAMRRFAGKMGSGAMDLARQEPEAREPARSPAVRKADEAQLRRVLPRVRRRVLPEWERRDPRRLRPVSPRDSAADLERLRRLHRLAIRWRELPASLPTGPWVWFVPEGLAPYADLRGWRAPALRHRPLERIEWIPEALSRDWVKAATARMRERQRPVLWATLFRGRPDGRGREAMRPILRLPTLTVVAHLLDETWPTSPENGRFVTALTSGPCAESLDALAYSLDAAFEACTRREAGRRMAPQQ